MQAVLQDSLSYDPGLGDFLYKKFEMDTTNADGYWEIPLIRNIDRTGADNLYTVTIDPYQASTCFTPIEYCPIGLPCISSTRSKDFLRTEFTEGLSY